MSDPLTPAIYGLAMQIARAAALMPAPRLHVAQTSQVWTALVTGWHRITAIGPGGSGGVARASYLVGQSLPTAATGGGAGGHVQKTIWLEAGAEVEIVIGAPGEGAQGVGNGAARNGNDGGDTTVTGPGFALLAGGGKGGAGLNGGTLSGAAGGMASGGDLNFAGGGSGAISISNNSVATGGGAVGVFGAGNSSTNINGAATGLINSLVQLPYTPIRWNNPDGLRVAPGAGANGTNGITEADLGGTPGGGSGGSAARYDSNATTSGSTAGGASVVIIDF